MVADRSLRPAAVDLVGGEIGVPTTFDGVVRFAGCRGVTRHLDMVLTDPPRGITAKGVRRKQSFAPDETKMICYPQKVSLRERERKRGWNITDRCHPVGLQGPHDKQVGHRVVHGTEPLAN